MSFDFDHAPRSFFRRILPPHYGPGTDGADWALLSIEAGLLGYGGKPVHHMARPGGCVEELRMVRRMRELTAAMHEGATFSGVDRSAAPESLQHVRPRDSFLLNRDEEGFLLSLEVCPRPPSRADIDRLVEEFYALPENSVGGSLHVVLDDNNWEREHVQFCKRYANERGDVSGERFADLLLTLTDDQLRAWLGPGYCGTCLADYGDAHRGSTFNTPDGRCPDCCSWPSTEDE